MKRKAPVLGVLMVGLLFATGSGAYDDTKAGDPLQCVISQLICELGNVGSPAGYNDCMDFWDRDMVCPRKPV